MKQYLDNNQDLDKSFTIGTRSYDFNVLEELDFSFETINDDFQDHAKKTALIQSMYEQAKTKHAKLEVKLKRDKARLWNSLKNNHTDDNGKVLSDKRVDLAVAADENLYTQEVEVIEAEGIVQDLKGILQSFAERKDLIQSFNTNLRKTI